MMNTSPFSYNDLSETIANSYMLALSVNTIPYEIEKGAHGWDILIDAAYEEEATRAIEEFLFETHTHSSDTYVEPLFPEYINSYAGIWISLVLIIIHIGLFLTHEHDKFIKIYGASARSILQGEYYRTVTALMLHRDTLHLIGNSVFMGLLGSAVCTIFGWGSGLLAVLISGIIGNLLNAYLYEVNHHSIGASTAVFGALGILTGYQWVSHFSRYGFRLKSFAALAAGLALLGFLGASKDVDILAHFFGFISGLIIGIFYHLWYISHKNNKTQTIHFILFVLIILLSFLKI
ncbi:MAG: rhomboid family intramembrane serine protease [Desulfobacterales bacterium]|nr:rhomboid family intramembrane serine protease [Desulfobacterales bacterium]